MANVQSCAMIGSHSNETPEIPHLTRWSHPVHYSSQSHSHSATIHLKPHLDHAASFASVSLSPPSPWSLFASLAHVHATHLQTTCIDIPCERHTVGYSEFPMTPWRDCPWNPPQERLLNTVAQNLLIVLLMGTRSLAAPRPIRRTGAWRTLASTPRHWATKCQCRQVMVFATGRCGVIPPCDDCHSAASLHLPHCLSSPSFPHSNTSSSIACLFQTIHPKETL
mmetsp:Transcript_417/g.1582  ORF Transcript_417/g.1582 Transcript_417/m.1582 type:complete len:223 (-) Transcript_417:313-981(-)